MITRCCVDALVPTAMLAPPSSPEATIAGVDGACRQLTGCDKHARRISGKLKPTAQGRRKQQARMCGGARAYRLLLKRLDELLAALQVGVEALHRPNDFLPARCGVGICGRFPSTRACVVARLACAHILFFFVRFSSCEAARDRVWSVSGRAGHRRACAPAGTAAAS